ncbi:tetratricopeptide repeat protein [Pseudanabaena sp. UWO311]|uniref:CHAT domain-containing protein n=1 Tax=Pseudanabaena sp. UWO311 TaxID=2487337 RepID=UPI00115AB575|nr:tetratricopeptide repeat protein [Pseudanabaena sp. UWO311]TYQ27329.1 tetratricopeptide repeat protein [Pseudanabaena sp. UWO311]
MQSRQKSSKFAHLFLLPFYFFPVGGTEVAKAQVRREGNAEIAQKSTNDTNILANRFDPNSRNRGIDINPSNVDVFIINPSIFNPSVFRDPYQEAELLYKQAQQQYQANQFEIALQSWQKALTIYRQIEDHNNEANSLHSLGLTYANLRQYQRAVDLYQQSLEIKKRIGDQKGESDILDSLGRAYRNLEQYQKAIDVYQQALAIKKQIGDRKGESDILDGLGRAYKNLEQYQKVIDVYQQALAIDRELGNRDTEVRLLSILGGAYNILEQYQKAIDFYQQSLAIVKQISSVACALDSISTDCLKERNIEGDLLFSIGNAYYQISDYQKAIDLFQQSLAIKKQIGDLNGQADSLSNLASVYLAIGQYQKIIDFYQQALAIKRQIGDRKDEGKLLSNLGSVYLSLGQHQRAIDFYQEALAIAKQIRDRDSEVSSLSNLASVYNLLGQYQRAIDLYQQALAIVKQISNRGYEGALLVNLGIAYSSLEQYKQANDFFQQSLAIKKQIGDSRGVGIVLANLGANQYRLGRYKQATDFLQQSLAIHKQIGDLNSEGTLLNNLGSFFNYLEQSELAILFYKQSINVREAIRKDIKKLDKDLQQSYLATVEDSYRRLADILLQQNRIIEALQVLDLLKVQELEDYLKNIKGSDRSAQGVRLLAPELALSDKLLAVSFDNAPELNRQLANQIQQLPKSEINKVPDYLNQIPNGTVLLYPFILGDRLEIILFAPNKLPIRRTTKISKDQLETLIIDFRAGLLDAGSEDFREPSIQLYNLLIKPIETELAQLNTKTILYAPDGQLRYIPIAALYDGKQWLVEKYQISNLIAYTLSDFTPQPKSAPNILAGAFGGKAGDRKFGQTALPATVREVQAIANSFQNSVTLIEDQFSRQAIESKFKNHNILHLATHAEFNSGAPDNSFIIFGNGDKIRLNEITDWQIPNIDLIILSACQTGAGKLGSGVEILGFGYQVQKAVAKQAIASLWSVNDEGTQALMEAFYDELKKGDVSSTEALHRAQVAMIKSKKYNHPNYWSAFFAIGNGL